MHRRRVGDHDLAGRGAEHDAAEPVADRLPEVHPALVPAADQPRAPLLADEAVEPVAGRQRRAPERVAVEVGDDAVHRDEAVAEGAERVGRVEVAGAVLERRGGRGGAGPLAHRRMIDDRARRRRPAPSRGGLPPRPASGTRTRGGRGPGRRPWLACRIAATGPRAGTLEAMSTWSQIEAEKAFARAARARRRAVLACRVGLRRACGCGSLAVHDGIRRAPARPAPTGVREIDVDAIGATVEPNRAAQFDDAFRPTPPDAGPLDSASGWPPSAA